MLTIVPDILLILHVLLEGFKVLLAIFIEVEICFLKNSTEFVLAQYFTKSYKI